MSLPDLPDPQGATRLIVVRHTEPDEATRGQCYGSTDVALSATGRAHASALAARLATLAIDVALSSPRQRAVDTAAPIAARQGLRLGTLDALRELDFGDIEGRTYDDIAATMPELWAAWMTTPTEVRFPGGESYGDLRARVQTAVAGALERHAGRTILVVTHGGVARAILSSALGMPDASIFRIDQRYGAINIIDWYDGTPVARLINA